MLLRVTRAEYLGGYRFALTFNDGHAGSVDLEDRLQGPAFAALKDLALFARGRLDPEVGTVVWPGDVDFAPEYLLYRALPHAPELQRKYRQWGYLTRSAASGS
jgi:hypothetical protein